MDDAGTFAMKPGASSSARFLFDGIVPAESFELGKEEAHKIKNVLRLASGDGVSVCGTDGAEYLCGITEVSSRRVVLTRGELIAHHPLPRRIEVAIAAIKPARMDWAIEKACEFGVERIIPFVADRSSIREISDERIERWRNIAKAAALQSGNFIPPLIRHPAKNLEDCLNSAGEGYELYSLDASGMNAAELIERRRERTPAVGKHLVIGPEGGWSEIEHTLIEKRTQMISLGDFTLRTESAVIAGVFVARQIIK